MSECVSVKIWSIFFCYHFYGMVNSTQECILHLPFTFKLICIFGFFSANYPEEFHAELSSLLFGRQSAHCKTNTKIISTHNEPMLTERYGKQHLVVYLTMFYHHRHRHYNLNHHCQCRLRVFSVCVCAVRKFRCGF